MVFTTYWLEKRLWGLAPFGYHLVNVLLHAANALLLWRLLARLGLPGAGWAAALFALHPMCVESVAWITERKNTLSLFLSLLAMLAYLASRDGREEKEKKEDFLRKGKRARARQRSRPRPQRSAPRRAARSSSFAGILGFSFFVLALFAKTTAVVVPAVLLVLVWWKRGELRGRDVGPLVPWFAAGIALAAHTAWLERTVVAASGKEWSLGLVERFVLAGRTVFFYSKKFLLPGGSLLLLRAMDDRRALSRPVAPGPRRPRRPGPGLAFPRASRPRPARVPPPLRRRPLPRHGLLQRLRDAVLLGRGPLRVPGRRGRLRGPRAAEPRRSSRRRRRPRGAPRPSPPPASSCSSDVLTFTPGPHLRGRGSPLERHAFEESFLLHPARRTTASGS